MLQGQLLRLVGWCLATALGLGLQACAITHVLRVADAQRIPVSQLVAELQPTGAGPLRGRPTRGAVPDARV